MILQESILIFELLDDLLHLIHQESLAISGSLGVHTVSLTSNLIEFGGSTLGVVLAEELIVNAVSRGCLGRAVDVGVAIVVVLPFGVVLTRQDESRQFRKLGSVRYFFWWSSQQRFNPGILRDSVPSVAPKESHENIGGILLVNDLPESNLFLLQLIETLLKRMHGLLLSLPSLSGMHAVSLATVME